MSCELGLRFDDPVHVVVTLNEAGRLQTAKAQEFAAPLDAEVQRDLQWYFEVYPVQYTTEIDDERASRIGIEFLPGARRYSTPYLRIARRSGSSIAFRTDLKKESSSPSAAIIRRYSLSLGSYCATRRAPFCSWTSRGYRCDGSLPAPVADGRHLT